MSVSQSTKRHTDWNKLRLYPDPATRLPRGKVQALVLLLYLATLSVDAGRKVIGLPGSTFVVIYVLSALAYLLLLPGVKSRLQAVPRALPVWLVLLSAWCVIEAIIQRVPVSMAVLGSVTYVFFVPLLYIGAELLADDRIAAKTLRVVAITGAAIGLGAVASAILGQHAPPLLQPIVPSVGIHDFNTGSIYLAPSIFASAEEAAEYLLIALFAWIALVTLPAGGLRRISSTFIAVLIATGLIAAERRADIVVAVVGVVALVVLRPATSPGVVGPRPHRTAPAPRGRLAPALVIAAVGMVALVSFLGTSKLVPFLTSESSGQNALTFMFSPAHPSALIGQGTGTSTQGINLVGGATTFDGINSNGPYIGYALDGRSFMTAEGGLTKTWLELGIVGVLLYGGVFFSVLAPAVFSLRRLDGIGRALTLLTLALGIIFLKGHQSLDDPLVQPLFWIGVGGAWGRMQTSKRKRHGEVGAASPELSRNNLLSGPVSPSSTA